MNTVTLGIASLDDMMKRASAAFEGKKQSQFIGFVSVELLWKVLTEKRWGILQVMTGKGEISLREVARGVNRDVKSVHRDVTALLAAGVIERGEKGGIVFPYDAVRVAFTLQKSAA